MPMSREKTDWLMRLGILPAPPAEDDAAGGGAAPGAGDQSSSEATASTQEEEAAQASLMVGYQEDHAYSGTMTAPPPPPPKPAPPPAPPPAQPRNYTPSPPRPNRTDVTDEPVMTPMDAEPAAEETETLPPPAAQDGPNYTPSPPQQNRTEIGDAPNMTPMPANTSPSAPNYTPNPPAPNRSEAGQKEPEKLGGQTPGVTEQFEFSLETHPVKAWGGKIEVSYKVTVQATASFLPNEDTQIQLTYNTKEGILKKAATGWPLENAMKAMGAPALLDKSKITLEGEMSDKGVTVKAGYALETPYGTVEVSGVLLKLEHGKTPGFGAIELAYTSPKLIQKDWIEDNIQVGQASLTIKGAATIQPQWARMIAEDIIKEAGIDAGAEIGAEAAAEAGVEAAAAETGTSAAAVIEVAIPAALAVVAVGTAVGVANMFVQKASMDNLKSTLAAAIRDLRGGLNDGLAGTPASGSGDLYTQGYALGSQAYQAAGQTFMAKVGRPPLPDEAPLIRAVADKAAMKWSGLAKVEDVLRWGFFNRWVDENHGLGTFKGAAQEAVLWCFGVPNEPSTGPHMKVWVAKSALPDALKE